MRFSKLVVLVILACLAAYSCSKSIDTPAPQPPILPLPQPDTTTLDSMKFYEADAAGNIVQLLQKHYFFYDTNYRITGSYSLSYAGGLPPDTNCRREYYYKNGDSLPYKLIYHYDEKRNNIVRDVFYNDTSWYTYNGQGRLLIDSGTILNSIGYGLKTWYSRMVKYDYSITDSVTGLLYFEPLGGNFFPFGSMRNSIYSIKNSRLGSTHIQKLYNATGQLQNTYIATYDTLKNPLQKAMLQVYPHFENQARDLGDGEFGMRYPQTVNRLSFIRIATNNSTNYNYTYSYIYNAGKLPTIITGRPLLSGYSNIRMELFY